MIKPYMLISVPNIYARFNEEPYEFLEELSDICMTYSYLKVSQGHCYSMFSSQMRRLESSSIDIFLFGHHSSKFSNFKP